MAQDRTAVDTIKGYFYQFDFYILQILESQDNYKEFIIEGIEDVDIETPQGLTAVQCKYYEGTEFNYSKISKAVRLMLDYFVEHRNVSFFLYGHFKSRQDKITTPIPLDILKSKLLTYKRDNKEYKLHVEKGLSDDELSLFLRHLKINIEAPSIEDQLCKVYKSMKEALELKSDVESHLFYAIGLNIVRELSTSKDIGHRKITRGKFIDKIKNTKKDCLDIWFKKRVSEDVYCASIRRKYFASYNKSPKERFFIIDATGEKAPIIKKIIQTIITKWTNISQRQTNPYCPYVYIHGVLPEDKLELLKSIYNDGVVFIDGYNYLNAEFDVNSIIKSANHRNGIVLKVIEEADQILKIIQTIQGKQKEIYQFYKEKEIITCQDAISILIDEIDTITKMI